MKLRRILICSLALNLALAAIWWFALGRDRPERPPAPAGASPGLPVAQVNPGPPSAATTNDLPAAPASPFPWRRIESDDYPQYMANLRATGCPERLIRDIIVAAVDALYAGRPVSTNAAPLPPWANNDRRRAEEWRRTTNSFALLDEKRELLRRLLGYEWEFRADKLWELNFDRDWTLGFLPAMKEFQLAGVLDRYERLCSVVRVPANDILIAEDRAQLRALRQQLAAELAGQLTPLELEEFKARVQTVFFLFPRQVLPDGVDWSGWEYRRLAGLSTRIKEAYTSPMFEEKPLSDEELARRKKLFEPEVGKVLGPERFADYLRAQDSLFGDVYRFAKERGLPKSTSVAVYDDRRLAEEQAREVRDDQTLSADEQAAALKVLKAVTQQKISAALGPASTEYIDIYGQWLDGLTFLMEPQESPPQ